MRRAFLCIAAIHLLLPMAFAQPQAKPWFASIDFGEAQTKLSSDQRSGAYDSTFALGFTGGHRFGQQARIGGQINGQLLQAFNLNDPTVGVSVSHVFAICDLFPVRDRGFFVRGGTGLSIYTNNHPDGYGGHGLGWTAGAGHEFTVTRNFALAPIFDYTGGRFGSTINFSAAQTGRTFTIYEFKLAFIFHFGSEKN